jgi:hypothetical protein
MVPSWAVTVDGWNAQLQQVSRGSRSGIPHPEEFLGVRART